MYLGAISRDFHGRDEEKDEHPVRRVAILGDIFPVS